MFKAATFLCEKVVLSNTALSNVPVLQKELDVLCVSRAPDVSRHITFWHSENVHTWEESVSQVVFEWQKDSIRQMGEVEPGLTTWEYFECKCIAKKWGFIVFSPV